MCTSPIDELGREIARMQRLRAAGDRVAALTGARALLPLAPRHAALTALIVKLAAELPAQELTFGALTDVLQDDPDHVGTHAALMDYRFKSGFFEEILIHYQSLSDRIAAAPRLVERHAHALIRCGRAGEAQVILGALPDPHKERLSVRRKQVQAYRSVGDLYAALTLLASMLRDAPDDHQARLALAQILVTQGRSEEAAAACEEGLKHGGPAVQFRYEQAKQLNRKGAFAAQNEVLAQLVTEYPDFCKGWLDLAALKAKRGDIEGALVDVERVPPHTDEHLIALSRKAMLLRRLGRARDAIPLLRAALSERNAQVTGKKGELTEIRVRYLEALAEEGRLAEGAEEAAQVIADLDVAPQRVLCELCRLGMREGDIALLSCVLRVLLEREVLSLSASELLLELAGDLLSEAERDGVISQLWVRQSPADQTFFEIQVAAACVGPTAAVARARKHQSGGFKAAERLGALLLDSGEVRLAARYLQLCVRRWPEVVRLHDLLIEAYLTGGAAAQCRALIDQVRSVFDGDTADRYEVKLLIAKGDVEAAARICACREGRGLRTLGHAQMAHLSLAVGDLDGAAQAITRLKQMWGARSKKARHFRVSYLGQLYDEAQLHAATQTAQEPRDAAVERYFFPAAQVVKQAPVEKCRGQLRQSIPRTVFQYWDKADLPPEVHQVMASWQGLPGYEYRRYTRCEAQLFLREAFGPEEEKAFLLANNVAEECDFLRLCLLHHFGGIYVDADDRHLGQLDALLKPPADLILCREPFGAIANNFLCAVPGHPLMQIAIDLSSRALLSRSRECTWSKTGPGMLTRATALFVSQGQEGRRQHGVRILSNLEMRQVLCPHVVLPYKSKPNYWNAEDRQFNLQLREVLLSL